MSVGVPGGSGQGTGGGRARPLFGVWSGDASGLERGRFRESGRRGFRARGGGAGDARVGRGSSAALLRRADRSTDCNADCNARPRGPVPRTVRAAAAAAESDPDVHTRRRVTRAPALRRNASRFAAADRVAAELGARIESAADRTAVRAAGPAPGRAADATGAVVTLQDDAADPGRAHSLAARRAISAVSASHDADASTRERAVSRACARIDAAPARDADAGARRGAASAAATTRPPANGANRTFAGTDGSGSDRSRATASGRQLLGVPGDPTDDEHSGDSERPRGTARTARTARTACGARGTGATRDVRGTPDHDSLGTARHACRW